MQGQLAFIQGIAGFDRLFHNCVINQFSLVSVNKKFNHAYYFDEHKKLFYPLNRACYNLYAFCDLCLNDPELPPVNKVDFERAKEAVAHWKTLLAKGSAFLTYYDAELVIDALKKNGYDFNRKLFSDKYKAVPLLFTNIAIPIRSFLRMDFYIPEQGKYDLLTVLIELLGNYPDLFHFVECMEVAIDDQSLMDPSVSSQHPVIAPSISLFFDKQLVQTHTMEVVRRLLDAVYDISCSCTIPEDVEFSYSIGHVVLSQGRRNYKKFLRLLTLLDQVYDPEFNHAFITKDQVMAVAGC